MNRKLLWMLVSMFILQVTPGFAEGTVAYLYTFFRYNWEFEAYSTYQTITSLARVIGMTLFVPIIKATGANEVHIVLGTQLTFIVRCIIIGIAPVGWMYYLGRENPKTLCYRGVLCTVIVQNFILRCICRRAEWVQ